MFTLTDSIHILIISTFLNILFLQVSVVKETVMSLTCSHNEAHNVNKNIVGQLHILTTWPASPLLHVEIVQLLYLLHT